MLPLVYARRSEGISAEYNQLYAALATTDFLARLDHGEETYLDLCRSMGAGLYRAALQPSGKSWFVDKTPRYFLIIDALAKLYPQARFIFLLRSPVAVLASILAYNFDGNMLRMLRQEDRRKDLMEAPGLIRDGIKIVGSRAITIKYEALVRQPETEMRQLCRQLEIPFDSQMLEYGAKTAFKDTTFVDTKTIYQHKTPVEDYIQAWKETLDSPEKIALAIAYVEFLGEDLLSVYGESMTELLDQLEAHAERLKKSRVPANKELYAKLLTQGAADGSRFTQLRREWQLGQSGKSLYTKSRRVASMMLRGTLNG